MYRKHLKVVMVILFALFSITSVMAADAEPNEPVADGTEVGTPGDATAEEIGIEDGEAAMMINGADGEPLDDQLTVGENGQYLISEDLPQGAVQITEHSVVYNEQAQTSAAIPPEDINAQWVVTDANGDVMQGMEADGSTGYAKPFEDPGLYNLGNGGVTTVASSTATVEAADQVELEVSDITAPQMRVVLTPEDTHIQNSFIIKEDPDNLNAYPIIAKTGLVNIEGRNWSKQGAAGSNAPVEIEFTTAFGMVTEEDLPNIEDTKLNAQIQAKNAYTLNKDLDPQLDEGFYVPVSVRTNFAVFTEADNDPRTLEEHLSEKKKWTLIIEKDGDVAEFQNTDHYIFRTPNYDNPDGPKYTLIAESWDASNNRISCTIPIIVIPKDLDIKNIDTRSSRID